MTLTLLQKKPKINDDKGDKNDADEGDDGTMMNTAISHIDHVCDKIDNGESGSRVRSGFIYKWVVQFLCPGTKLFRGGCIHNEGYLKGVALQPEPVLGPKQASE